MKRAAPVDPLTNGKINNNLCFRATSFACTMSFLVVSVPAVRPEAVRPGSGITVTTKMCIWHLCEGVAVCCSVDHSTLATARTVEAETDLESPGVLRGEKFKAQPVFKRVKNPVLPVPYRICGNPTCLINALFWLLNLPTWVRFQVII